MSPESASGTGGPGRTIEPLSSIPTGLSYEGVLATLQQRLGDINNQINSVRETIEQRSQRANEIADQIQALKDLKTVLGEEGEKKVHFNELSPEQQGILREAGMGLEGDIPTEEELAEAKQTERDARGQIAEGFTGAGPEREVTSEDLAAAEATIEAHEEAEISVEEIENAISQLNTDLQKVNSDNETLMVQLQEAVSQRQVQIQLATSSMRAISDGEKKIAGNVGA